MKRKSTLLRAVVAGFALIAGTASINAQVLYYEPFNTSLGTTGSVNNSNGSWIYTNSCAQSAGAGHTAPGSAIFSGAGCQFGNGGNTVSANLQTPSFFIPASGASLAFNYALANECGTGTCPYDILTVQISTNGGASWTSIDNSNTGSLVNAAWTAKNYSLAAYSGMWAMVRFNFNSVDGAFNAYDGIYIDDILVAGTGLPQISGLSPSYCINSPAVTVSGNPLPGTLSGPGVTGNTFNPATAGAGAQTISFNSAVSGLSYSVFTGLAQSVLTGAATGVALGDDQLSAAINIGFTFNFYGTNFTQFIISSNGFLTFPGSTSNGCCSGQVLPNATIPNNGINGSWNDLNPGAGGTIGYFVAGVAPNRVLCVNFTGVPHFAGGGTPITLQYQLYEGTNVIEVHSTNNITDGSAHTMGLENNAGNAAVAPGGRNGSTTFNVVNEMTRFVPYNAVAGTSTVTVMVNALPTVSSTATPGTTVCSGTSVTLSGTGATSYAWTGGVTNAVAFTPASTGSYTVTGTDANGCSNTATTTITVNPLPTVGSTATPGNTVCSGTSVTLSGTGASSYTWTGGITDAVPFTATATTSYTVTGTAANGCSNTANVTVTVNALPTVNYTTTPGSTVCNGTNVTLAGTGATSYSWTGGVTDGVAFAATASNTYTVTGTDVNGCVNTATASITVNALPTVTATAANGTVCDGTSETLTASGASTYAWSSGGTAATETVTPSTTSTYTVTGTDANGCMNTATVTVNVNALPTVTATATNGTICDGGSETLNAGGASTYVWSSGGTAATEVVMPNTTSTYTVTGTDANGCVNTATVTVNVNALPVVNLGADVAQCGGTVTLDAGNVGATYLWSDASTSQTDVISASGTYYVDVTDANGCSSSDTAMVAINAFPVVNLGLDVVQCGGTVTLDAGNAGSTYLWSDASTSQTDVISASGTYYVDVTDANGCSSSDTAMVTINTPPTVTGSAASSTVCFDDANVALTGSPAGGTWSGPGVSGSSFDPSVAGNGSQTATYTYTDGNGCTGTATATITVNPCTGVAEATLENGVNVFPNPSSGEFTISINANLGNVMIEMTDVSGRIVYSSLESGVQAGFTKQVSTADFANGIYTLRLVSGSAQNVIKVSVQK